MIHNGVLSQMPRELLPDMLCSPLGVKDLTSSKGRCSKPGLVSVQAQLWSFYDEASVFGREVQTTGGGRGPSRAFFVPSLSTMQLFMPADGSAQSSANIYTLSDAVAAQVCALQCCNFIFC